MSGQVRVSLRVSEALRVSLLGNCNYLLQTKAGIDETDAFNEVNIRFVRNTLVIFTCHYKPYDKQFRASKQR